MSRGDCALQIAPLRRLYERLPWLLVGLVGSLVATTLMASFESLLSASVAVAFFELALAYLADAIGTQTEAAAVRYVSFHDPFLRRLLLGGFATGLLIGAALATVVFPLAYAFCDLRLAAATCVSLVAASTTGRGPGSTIVQDLRSILVYFETVSFVVVCAPRSAASAARDHALPESRARPLPRCVTSDPTFQSQAMKGRPALQMIRGWAPRRPPGWS